MNDKPWEIIIPQITQLLDGLDAGMDLIGQMHDLPKDIEECELLMLTALLEARDLREKAQLAAARADLLCQHWMKLRVAQLQPKAVPVSDVPETQPPMAGQGPGTDKAEATKV